MMAEQVIYTCCGARPDGRIPKRKRLQPGQPVCSRCAARLAAFWELMAAAGW